MLKTIDAILNRYTMYRVITYGLGLLLLAAVTLAFTGAISISAIGLLVSVAVLCAGCYASNRLFAALFKAPYNTESWLISALILACILPPATTLQRAVLVALAGALAMASKYLLVWRGSHFLNPAATGAFVMSVTGLLPATWWVATPTLTLFMAVLALVVLRKQRRFTLFFAFTLVAVLLMVYIGSVLHDRSVAAAAKDAFLSWPILFFGSIMLTEPSTLPPTRYYQVLFAVLTGAVFASQLHVGVVASTPQTALLIGNIFTLIATPAAGAMLRLKAITQLAPNLYDLAFERPQYLQFTPGQYLEWTLPHRGVDSRGNRRTFSIASSPTEPDLHIGIKTYEPSSSFKKSLLSLQHGVKIRVAHVAGGFTLPEHPTRPLVFIAGGIGITPFRSMLKHLADTGQQREMLLLYVANSEAEFVYRDVLDQAALVGLQTRYIVGRIEEDMLKANLPLLRRSLVYVSGPDAMVSHYKGTLARLGVPRGSIKTDHFTGY